MTWNNGVPLNAVFANDAGASLAPTAMTVEDRTGRPATNPENKRSPFNILIFGSIE